MRRDDNHFSLHFYQKEKGCKKPLDEAVWITLEGSYGTEMLWWNAGK